MATLKPIETVYNGNRFRSRLEARWAVFMSTLFVRYEYEPEGFELDGLRYLPDFYLPDQRLWLEIKPPGEVVPEFEPKAFAFDQALKGSGDRFAICCGEPWWDSPCEPRHEFNIVLYPPSGEPDIVLFTCLCWTECPKCGVVAINTLDGSPRDADDSSMGVFCSCAGDASRPAGIRPWLTPSLMRAYQAARSVRFA